MASLLIIGGTGFFGKSILDSYKRKLLKPWSIDKILVMSRNVEGFEKTFPELISDGVTIFSGDISTIDYLPEADFVIHAAAITDTSLYINGSENEKKNIISGTLNYVCQLESEPKQMICEFCADHGERTELAL